MPCSPLPRAHVRRVRSGELCNVSPEAYARKLNALTTLRGREEQLNPNVLRAVEREFKRQRSLSDTVRTLPDENFTCPACARRCRMLVVDANFKCYHYRYASEYHAARKPVVAGQPGSAAAFFQEDDVVNKMLGALTLRGGPPTRTTCGTAEIDAMRGKTHASYVPTDIDAIYVACCSHGCLRTAFNFKGGEKGVYLEAILQLANYKVGILCGDSVCRLQGLLERYENARDEIEPALRAALDRDLLHACPPCAVNAMHVIAVRARARARPFARQCAHATHLLQRCLLTRAPAPCCPCSAAATCSTAGLAASRTAFATP